MPFYRYTCEKCQNTRDVLMSMMDYEELNNNQICECNNKMKRVYTTPQITLGFKEYYDIGLNRMISSKNNIKEIEKREGKMWGDDKELRQESRLNKKRNQEEFRKKHSSKMREGILKSLASK